MAVVGEHSKRAVADRTRIVRDPAVGTLRQIIKGQPVPADLVDAEDGDTSVVDEQHRAGRVEAKASRKASKDG